jgi:hypothetical protein
MIEINNSYKESEGYDHLALALDRVEIMILNDKIDRLKVICNELNPYLPISEDMKNQLLEFGIEDFSDPFKITNTLIFALENYMEELNLLSPFMHE